MAKGQKKNTHKCVIILAASSSQKNKTKRNNLANFVGVSQTYPTPAPQPSLRLGVTQVPLRGVHVIKGQQRAGGVLKGHTSVASLASTP
jgi:hypothetical protein